MDKSLLGLKLAMDEKVKQNIIEQNLNNKKTTE